MTTTLTTEREQIWVSLETGEIAETHAEAMELYRAGHELEIQCRYRYNGGDWGDWQVGCRWVH